MKTKYIKISFNDDTKQSVVDYVVETLSDFLTLWDVTAIMEVGEDNCEAEDA